MEVAEPDAAELFPDRVVDTQAKRARSTVIAPIAAERYSLKLTVSQCLVDKLRQAQELAPHHATDQAVPEVLEQALDLYIE